MTPGCDLMKGWLLTACLYQHFEPSPVKWPVNEPSAASGTLPNRNNLNLGELVWFYEEPSWLAGCNRSPVPHRNTNGMEEVNIRRPCEFPFFVVAVSWWDRTPSATPATLPGPGTELKMRLACVLS